MRRWLRDGDFDVVHVHEPAPPSLSLLACMIHDGPLVATFHVAIVRSRFLSVFDTVLQPFLEKITGRIAVSPAARKVIVEHLGGDAVVIPNGVAVAHYADAEPFDGFPRPADAAGGTIGFIGRYDEPRKGMDVLVDALDLLVDAAARTCGCWWPGAATPTTSWPSCPRPVAERVELLGPGQRGRQGPAAAQRRRLLRAQHRAGELRRHPARGDGGAHRDRGQRHRRVPAGARPAARPAGCSRSATPPALAAALAEVLDDAGAARPRWSRPAAPRWRPTTGR